MLAKIIYHQIFTTIYKVWRNCGGFQCPVKDAKALVKVPN